MQFHTSLNNINAFNYDAWGGTEHDSHYRGEILKGIFNTLSIALVCFSLCVSLWLFSWCRVFCLAGNKKEQSLRFDKSAGVSAMRFSVCGVGKKDFCLIYSRSCIIYLFIWGRLVKLQKVAVGPFSTVCHKSDKSVKKCVTTLSKFNFRKIKKWMCMAS